MKIDLPKNLNKQAVAYVNNMVRRLEEAEAIEEVDSEAIKMLAYNLSAFYDASEKLCKEGYTIMTDRGNVTASPWVRIQKDAQASAMRLMKDFGLTLASREKIISLNGTVDNSSPLDTFIKSNLELR